MSSTLTNVDRVYAVLAGGDSINDELLHLAHQAKPIPGKLNDREMDLLDYGVALGVAFALVRTDEPLQRPRRRVPRRARHGHARMAPVRRPGRHGGEVMPAKLETTKVQGVYKRGTRSTSSGTPDQQGRSRQESARTFAAACELRKRRQGAVIDGSYQAATRETLAEYAREWIRPLSGRRPARLHRGDPRRVSARPREVRDPPPRPHPARAPLTPRHVSGFVAWLCDENAQGERRETRTPRAQGQEGRRARRAAYPPKRWSPVYLADAHRAAHRFAAAVLPADRAPLEGVLRGEPRRRGRASRPATQDRRIYRAHRRRTTRATCDPSQTPSSRPSSQPPRNGTALMFRVLAHTGLRIGEVVALRNGETSG